MLIGFYSMTNLHIEMTTGDIVWRMLLLGMGLGPVMPLMNLAMQNAVPYAVVGAAVANRQFFQQLGQAIGAAIFGVILTTTLTQQISRELEPIIQKVPPSIQETLEIDSRAIRNAIGTEQASAMSPLASATITVNDRHRESLEQLRAIADGDTSQVNALLTNPTLPPDLVVAVRENTITPQNITLWTNVLDAQHAATMSELSALNEQIERALQRAFATSIQQIYVDAIWLVALSFILILCFLPELPLRKSNRDATPLPE
jgi:hypothetical protein